MTEPTKTSDLFRKHFRRIIFETHTYEGRRLVKGVQATLKGKTLDSRRVGRPPVSLLPDDVEEKINAARQRVYNVLAEHTFPVDSRGTRTVAISRAEDFVLAWNDAVVKFDEMADEVASERERIYAYNRDYWLPQFDYNEGEFYANVGRLVPTAEKLRARFGVSYRFEEATGLGAGFESDVVQAFFDEGLENTAKYDQNSIVQLATEPLKNYVDAVAAMRAHIDTGAKVVPNVVNASRGAAKFCLNMGAIIAPAVIEAIEKLNAVLGGAQAQAIMTMEAGGTSTQYFKDHKAELFAAIDATVAACADTSSQQAMIRKFGAMPRGIEFDDDAGDDLDDEE